MKCVYCGGKCGEDYSNTILESGNSQQQAMIHDSCLSAYGKVNEPAPKSFREAVRKECEERIAECHITSMEGCVIKDPPSYQAGKKLAYKHILHLIARSDLFADDPLAEFRAKLQEHIRDIQDTGYSPDAESLCKWIAEH